MVKADRIEELEEQIAALKRQWPAHSVPPSLLQRLDDLEDELELERKKVAEDKKNAYANGCGELSGVPSRGV
jgi:uncharacterized protein (UPF0335 family)